MCHIEGVPKEFKKISNKITILIPNDEKFREITADNQINPETSGKINFLKMAELLTTSSSCERLAMIDSAKSHRKLRTKGSKNTE